MTERRVLSLQSCAGWWLPVLVGVHGCSPCEFSLAAGPHLSAWEQSVEDVGARLEAEGQCPDAAPEHVVMTNGCVYADDTVTVDATIAFLYAQLWLEADPPERRVEFRFSPTGGEVDCELGATDTFEFVELGSEMLLVDFSADDHGEAGGPLFLTSATNATLDITRAATIEDPWDNPVEAEGVYAWVCLEATPGPEEVDHYAPAAWRGSAFAHADDLNGAPVDLFLPFDGVACVYGEDAATVYGYRDGDPIFPSDCDAVDNDLDGIIDEGAADYDANGIADCLEDRG